MVGGGERHTSIGTEKAQRGHSHVFSCDPLGSHHVELPPDGGPLPERRGDLLNERQVARDDRFMLPGERGRRGS